ASADNPPVEPPAHPVSTTLSAAATTIGTRDLRERTSEDTVMRTPCEGEGRDVARNAPTRATGGRTGTRARARPREERSRNQRSRYSRQRQCGQPRNRDRWTTRHARCSRREALRPAITVRPIALPRLPGLWTSSVRTASPVTVSAA